MDKEYNYSENYEPDIDKFRSELSEEIPNILDKVTHQYRCFLSTENFDDIKSFTAYQTACRAALTHLQLLMKITSWIQSNIEKDISPDDDSEINRLILNARSEMRDQFDDNY